MDVKKYLKDPCNSLSMPYWKHKKTSTRSDIVIIHDSKYDSVLYREWHDTVQYRLKHDLQGLTSTKINDSFFYKTVDDTCLEDVLSVINQTEKEIEITKNDLNHWKSEDSFCKELWILVYNKKIYHRNKDKTIIYDEFGNRINTDKKYLPVGLMISIFDHVTKEASIELLEIIPAYRKLGLKESLVRESLLRISEVAEFVTVCGKVDADNNDFELYKKLGFADDAIWHVLKKNY